MPTTARFNWPAVAFAGVIAALLAIYGADVGHGFVKDDVVWVGENRVASWADVGALAMRSSGFYRPVVALTFAADRTLYDLRPFGYGVTNLLLAIACCGALVWLARGLGLGGGVAVLAAAIWALNFHGINMAVLWLSGRTALLVTLFALLAAGALVRGWPLTAAVAALLAMLSKEEAVLLPLILSAWVGLRPRGLAADEGRAGGADGVRASEADAARAGEADAAAAPGDRAGRVAAIARRTWAVWLALAMYLVLRSQTGAYTPASSPWFYRFTFAPAQVLANAAEYLDRACTFAVLTVIVASLVGWRRPRVTGRVRAIMPLALIWIAGSYALTLFLPVRSSLYACLPSIGAALLAAVAIETVWSAASVYPVRAYPVRATPQPSVAGRVRYTWRDARHRLVAVAIVLPLVLLPVYWSRNVRWVEIADLSNVTFAAVRDTVAAADRRATADAASRAATAGAAEARRDATPSRRAPHLVFEDDRSTRRSLVNTFGTLLPEAVALATGRRLPVWLDPPPDDWQGSGLTPPPPASADAPGAQVLRFRIEGNSLIAPVVDRSSIPR